jgi:CheY-like chemotaxis protein
MATGTRILVVDDDEAERETLALILTKAGYGVAEARDGAEALELLRGAPLPDLVIVDLMMPRVTGWQVLAAMHDSARLRHVPAVVLTSFGSNGLPHEWRVLHKPADPELLIAFVARGIQQAPKGGDEPLGAAGAALPT